MTSLYDRYCRGECVEVWNEFRSLGHNITEPPFRTQARDVAQEVVDRAFTNLKALHSTLLELDYHFARPDYALTEATEEDRGLLNRLEKQIGPIPIILRAWYEKVASVDFRQAESQLWSKGGSENSEVCGLGCNAVLVFLSLADSLSLRKELFEIDDEELDLSSSDEQILFPLGAYASNNEPKGFWLPDEAIDGVIYNEGSGDVYFVDELRSAFTWGGFPFWKLTLKKKSFYSPVGCTPNFPRLLPLLTQNMVPL